MMLKKIYGEVISTLLLHDKWRRSYNGDRVGRGKDEYYSARFLDYPESYAKYAIGYKILYDLINDDKHKDIAINCIDWLLKNKSPYFEHFSWGLPFQHKSVHANNSFLITTCFCGQAFLEFVNDDNTYYSDIVKSSIKWILSECVGRNNIDSIQLNYCPHKEFNYYIVNAASIALGYLSNAKYKDTNYCKLELNNIINAIINEQNTDGSWYYSEKSGTIDLSHTSYTLEGLWLYLKRNDNPELKKKAEKGTSYLLQNFFTLNGYGIMNYAYKLKDITSTRRFKARILKEELFYILNSLGLFENRYGETRLWGYAAAIRMLSHASYTNPEYLLNAIIIFKYLQKNQDELGYFYYNTKDKSCYIRHQAHTFEAISILAKTISEKVV